ARGRVEARADGEAVHRVPPRAVLPLVLDEPGDRIALGARKIARGEGSLRRRPRDRDEIRLRPVEPLAAEHEAPGAVEVRRRLPRPAAVRARRGETLPSIHPALDA